MKLFMGKYYKDNRYNGKVFRAILCTFCNGRKVASYHKCLFRGMGMMPQLPLPHIISRAVGCLADSAIKEITELEYIAWKLEEVTS